MFSLSALLAIVPCADAGTVRLRDAPADQVVVLAVGLRAAHPAAQERLATRVNDPDDPSFGRFLTAEQVARRFSQPPSVRRRLRGWLRGGGFRIQRVTGGLVIARGTVAGAEALFGTPLGIYRRGTQTFRAPDHRGRLPRALPIAGVLGLSTFRRLHRAGPEQGVFDAINEARTIGPRDLWDLYEAPEKLRGAGGAVAVFGTGDPGPAHVIESLTAFEKAHGLGRVPVRHVRTGTCPQESTDNCAADPGGVREWEINSQAVVGMAPDLARLDLYEAPEYTDVALLAAVTAWAHDRAGAPTAAFAFSGCEGAPLPGEGSGVVDYRWVTIDPALDRLMHAALVTAGLQGRTLFTSSGDSGAGCDYLGSVVAGAGAPGLLVQPMPLAPSPASSPWAIGVGGTDVAAEAVSGALRPLVERAWTYSGGNRSVFMPAPAWQTPALGESARPCPLAEDGSPQTGGADCRMVPDVAALAIYAGYLGGYDLWHCAEKNGRVTCGGPKSGTQPGAGTSLAAPLWAGLWARIAQGLRASRRPVGFAGPLLYRLGKDPKTYESAFTDVLVGHNGLHAAGPGYDLVTGLGTPRVASALKALKKRCPNALAGTVDRAARRSSGSGSAAARREARVTISRSGSAAARGRARSALRPARRFAHRRVLVSLVSARSAPSRACP